MNAAGWSPTTLNVSRALFARQRHFLRCAVVLRLFGCFFLSSRLGSLRGGLLTINRTDERAGEETDGGSKLVSPLGPSILL